MLGFLVKLKIATILREVYGGAIYLENTVGGIYSCNFTNNFLVGTTSAFTEDFLYHLHISYN